ncbi:MAG: DnaJ domain-containing protein [Alphaproteobacteria bacterium]|nr:DnaJ domain-containing protein [Alphaproteobacteria bacterium]
MIYRPKKKEVPFRPCDHTGCPACGEYRAPKDRRLKEYYWFCLKHVTEYNKNWDFYLGLSSEEIESHIQNDVTWQRPTWRLGENQTFRANLNSTRDTFGLFNEDELGMNGTYNPPQSPEQKHEARLVEAARFLEVTFPLMVSVVKKQYKMLAKKYHPDTNQGNTDAEHMFKKLNEHYRYIMKRLGEKP